MCNVKRRTWNVEHGTWNVEHETLNQNKFGSGQAPETDKNMIKGRLLNQNKFGSGQAYNVERVIKNQNSNPAVRERRGKFKNQNEN